MNFPENLNFNDFIGRHVLLYGEANTKKTYYTSKFIQFLVESKKAFPNDISILDFAPPLSTINNLKIGG
ncbi:unnamed protein product, partial [marine sediment metagenome]